MFEKALRTIVLAGVFALPFLVLYVSTSLFFPFITGKNFAFRIIIEIIAGAWFSLALVKTEYRPRRSWLLWAFAAFVLLIGISDIFGVYPEKSFWSNYERMEGWVTLAHLFVYFVVAVSVLNTERLWKYWWHTTLGVSVIVACIGLFQLAGWVPINQGGARVDARIGNATYLGVYMLFHVFMAALFLARAWVERANERTLYVSLYGGIILLNSFVLFFTATRGAILGLLGGFLLSGLILILLAPRSRVAWRVGSVIAAFIILTGAFWAVRDQAWVHRIEPLHRLATILSDGTTFSRFLNWGMALQGFKERPILGWGQENYAAVFDKYYNPAMYAQEQWFDRTHNIIFDWLIAGGILGLLAYFSLYLFALITLWRSGPPARDGSGARSGAFALYERAILTGLFAGYFFYLLFTFDNITSYLLFISLLAYIAARATAGASPPVRPPITPLSLTSLPIVVAVMLVGTGGLVWYVNADALAANRALIQGLMPYAEGASKNLAFFEQALERGHGKQEIREQFAQAAMSVIGAPGVPNDLKQRFVQRAAEELVKQANDAPQHARGAFFLGILLDRAGAYADAKLALEQAHERSPQKQGVLFEFGLNAFARGANDEALQYFKSAYESAPQYAEAFAYYGAALIQTGHEKEAEELLAPLIGTRTAAHQRIAAAYAARGKFDAIIAIWSPYIEKNPTDFDSRLVIVSAYYSKGDRARALQELERMRQEIPGAAAQIDELIRQAQSGAIQ
ncbi:MAG: O-antigen ligase family protein [Patescibacteria group bacterium]